MARPLGIFFWFFALALPASVAAQVFSTLVHEFAHGLTALALGGWFLGTRSQFLSPDAEVMAWADAWSESGGDLWIYAAGIAVNVAVGALLCRKAGRTSGAPARVLLCLAASAFLSDLGYAFEGCLHWRTASGDTAVIFDDLDSPELRWLGLVILFPAWAAASAIVARTHFRAWEDLLGPMSGRRALGVFVLFVAPLPWSLLRVEDDRSSLYLSLLIVVGVGIRVLRGRRRVFDVLPPARPGRWIAAAWSAGLLAAIVGGLFEKGFRFGTYPDAHVYELRPEERTVAGLVARFGMSDARGENRPAFDPKLFVATPEGSWTLPSPATELLDLTWRPSTRSFLAVTSDALYEIGESGREVIWEVDTLRAAGHGSDGELLLVLGSGTSMIAYDARARVLREFTTEGDIGNPFFLPGSPARARIGVGKEVWQLTWDEDGVRSEILPLISGGGWYEGSSAGGDWWSDEDGWWSGDTEISKERMSSWGVGLDGFYTLHQRGVWRLTTPSGRVEREGRLETIYYAGFLIHEGLPWLALKTGEVRRLDAGAPPFRVRLPVSAASSR